MFISRAGSLQGSKNIRGECFDEAADVIAHAAVGGELLLLGGAVGGEFAGDARGIVEAVMDDFAVGREPGAGFVGVIADGDDDIEFCVFEFVDVLGFLAGDVDTGFGHDFDGIGVEAVGFDAGAVGGDGVAFEVAGPSFGHLAAAGVSGTEEEQVHRRLERSAVGG